MGETSPLDAASARSRHQKRFLILAQSPMRSSRFAGLETRIGLNAPIEEPTIRAEELSSKKCNLIRPTNTQRLFGELDQAFLSSFSERTSCRQRTVIQ